MDRGKVSTIYTSTNEYWVVMELEPQYQSNLSALSLLYIRSTSGTLVPLSAVASVGQNTGALTVNFHSGQAPRRHRFIQPASPAWPSVRPRTPCNAWLIG